MRPLVVKPCFAALVTGVVAVLVTAIPAATGLGAGIAGASNNPTPSAPTAPAALAAPGVPWAQAIPGAPLAPTASMVPEAPAVPGGSAVSGGPTVSGAPAASTMPGAPAAAAVSGAPAGATVSGAPAAATVPGAPAAATVSGAPAAATVPGAPAATTVSGAPAAATVPGASAAPVVPRAPRVHRVPTIRKAHARPRAVHRCTTGQLGLGFRGLSAGAGQRSLTLVLSNMSRLTCSIRGYPQLQFHGAAGRALATHQTRIPGPRPTVVLRPGHRVRSCLRWAAISPPFINPRVIAVTPPGDHFALVVAWKWGRVFRGIISATAIMKGLVCS